MLPIRVDHGLVLRCALEFAMLIPAALLALLPVHKKLKYRPGAVYAFAGAIIVFTIFTGSFISVNYHLPSTAVLLAVCPSLFMAYHLTVCLNCRL